MFKIGLRGIALIMKDGKYAEIMTEFAEHLYRNSEIESVERNKRFTSPEGALREIDVLTTLKNGEEIAFEVRDRHSKPQGIDWIDQVIGKYSDTHFSQVWIYTFDGCTLTSDAIKKLQHHGLGWRDFTLLQNVPMSNDFPVLHVNGIKPVPENIEILVNGDVYTELTMQGVDDAGNSLEISFRDLVKNEFYQLARSNTSAFALCELFKYRADMEVPNNMGSESLHIEGTMPLKHCEFIDYFNESYLVENNAIKSILISSQEKSLILTEGKLFINWAYFLNMAGEGVILNDFFTVNIEAIPEKYRNFSQIGQIQPNGEVKCVVARVVGISKKI